MQHKRDILTSLAFFGSLGATLCAAPEENLKIPDWVHEARWYQVDVGWFRNGEADNDPRGTLPWGAPPPTHSRGTSRHAIYNPAHGADLQGLRQQLPYLTRLGVNTLYLTGVLRELGSQPAPGVHVQDWLGIPDSLTRIGVESREPESWQFTESDKLFLSFIDEAHRQGFRIILDDPFGRLDLALATNPDAKAHLFNLVKRWGDPNGDGNPADGVDGWATVGPIEHSLDIYRYWRGRIRNRNRDAILLGIAPSRDEPMRADGAFDVVVNYGAARALLRFVTRDRTDYAGEVFLRELGVIADRHPDSVPLSVAFAERNERFLDRLMKAVGGSSEGTNPGAEVAALWRLYTLLQHTIAGSPLTVYGDEVGLRMDASEMADGVRNLPIMPWDDLSNPESKLGAAYREDFLSWVQSLHALRDRYPAFDRGALRSVLIDDTRGIFAFGRALPGDEVVVAVNTSRQKHEVTLKCAKPGQLVAILTPQSAAGNGPGAPTAAKASNATSEASESATEGSPDRPKKPLVERVAETAVPGSLRMGGSRQFANDQGAVTFWVDPQSARFILINNKEPR